MRKTMTKEILMTKVKIARIGVSPEGQPTTEVLPDIEMLGNITREKAQKRIIKQHDQLTTIYQHEVFKQTYEIEIEELIKIAKLKEEHILGENEETESETEESENGK
jgi:hypothetical protein